MQKVIVLIIVFLLNFVLLTPFFWSIVWALILALILWPAHSFLVLKLKSSLLSSLIICTVIVLILVALVSPMLLKLYFEVSSILESLRAFSLQSKLNLQDLHIFGFHLNIPWEKFQNLIVATGNKALPIMVDIFSKTLGVVWDAVLALVILFFLLKDGDKIIKFVADLINFLNLENFDFRGQVVEITRRVFFSTIIVSFLQGVISFIGLLFFSVNYSLFVAFLVFLLSITPAGAALVYIPVSLFVAFESVYKGLGILLWHILLVSSVDNFLRPILISKNLKLPDGLILFATLGGLIMFGFLGLFIAPIILAISYSLVSSVLKNKSQNAKI